jgi:sulfite reductase (ferredoxin)
MGRMMSNTVTAYLDEREDGESFATWVVRADEQALRGERELEAVS